MKKLVIAALASVLATSGCSTYSLEELRQTTPQGNAFQTALAKLYMEYATREERDYDWENSWYFADKGLMAAYGKETPPENPENWEIPANLTGQFAKAYQDLGRVLTPETIAKNPELAAYTQFSYECWLEQQEEGQQPDEIEYCKYEYLKALSRLDTEEEVAKPAKKPVKTTKTAKKAKKPLAKNTGGNMLPTTTSFVVFFDTGESVLTVNADSVLSDIAKSLTGQESYEVIITNKAKGGKNSGNIYNERTATIKKRLIQMGIHESAVHSSIVESGISQLTIKRKVEIFIND